MTPGTAERRRKLVSIALTCALVLVALWAGRSVFTYYQSDPWTRDGRIRADVVQVAPDVGGLVTAVHFDHDQKVRRGDVLFEIDRARYTIALHEAEVAVQQAQAQLFGWLQAGEIAPRIDSVFSGAEAAKAHQHIHDRQNIGKVLLDFD